MSVLDVNMRHTLLWVLGVFLLLYCGHAQDVLLTIEPNWSTLFTGESVTFICDMREGKDTDWYYAIWQDGREIFPFSSNKRRTLQPLATGYSGEYQCIGAYNVSPSTRKKSNKVSLTVSDKDVILETPASTLFEGESVTLRCRHRTQTEEKNAVFYKDGSPIQMDTNYQPLIISNNTVQVKSDGSSYMCKFESEESEPIKLKMESRPKARLRKHVAGSKVTLTCSVNPSSSSGWNYYIWFRRQKTSEPLTTQDILSNEITRVTVGGVYRCRGGRGEPVYYTDYSDPVVTYRAVVTLQHNWPEIYTGETITLKCDIEDGGDTGWEYEWMTPSNNKPQKQKEYMIRNALSSDSGDYRCLGRLKGEQASTEWSDAFPLIVSDNKPRPVLTVSPSWLSPGASVTLSCSVKAPSAGWRFYWYKAVPDLSAISYIYDLLPGTPTGTEQESYIVDGQTHTAGYVCRAARGDPMFYTHYSGPTFVWSGDVHPAASLTVSPDRSQHFDQESLSLSCEGNSTKWRVKMFTELSAVIDCSIFGKMNGFTCNIDRYWLSGVYWCESDTGPISNAVNITIQHDDIILVSPVLPVAEGHSVTLGCELKTKTVLNNVDFYKNEKLIQNNTRGELTISAVSKSDEGFYKCEGKKSQGHWRSRTSEKSWMSVTLTIPGEISPFPVLLTVGLVCGVLLILLLLLLLYRYRKSNDSCFSRSTNQSPATDHMINQEETQHKDYASVHHGDACFYETIKVPEEPEHDESKDVTYSVVELKNIGKKGRNNEPKESAVYSTVKMASAAGSHAAADETLYSEVKPGTALGQ